MARRQTRSRTPSKKAAAATAQKKTTSKKKGNEKKYLLEDISELYTDPTFIFFFFCALVPAIKDGDIMKFVKFATSPILIFCYVLTYCVWTWPPPPLPHPSTCRQSRRPSSDRRPCSLRLV